MHVHSHPSSPCPRPDLPLPLPRRPLPRPLRLYCAVEIAIQHYYQCNNHDYTMSNIVHGTIVYKFEGCTKINNKCIATVYDHDSFICNSMK